MTRIPGDCEATMRLGFPGLACTVMACCGVVSFAAEDEFPARDLEFFEREVRPLLVERCHKCHGPQMQKGKLRLDSREAVLKGGETGPAIKPGDVEASLLIDAINYDPDGYQMPPTGKLSDEDIATLTEWVRRNAPWPDSQNVAAAADKSFNLEERAKHWSFQPLQLSSVPDVGDAAHPVDRFLLAKLADAELTMAPLAEKSTQLRRLSFELTGLPPTPEELDAFLADESPDAFERTVDRLLASPRYGERWARHWLDLVRFAETYGHEFDFEIRYPDPYRDYLIRAFNADVSYDQFVREHLAGDLLPEPRRDPATGNVESVIGTAFWWFSQGKHSPVDIRSEECDTVDNQLDVFGKTFLGLTIACARCHDHKFDAIRQADYYALAGYLQSSRQTYADITPPEQRKEIVAKLAAHEERHRSELVAESLERWRNAVDAIEQLLLSQGDFPQEGRDAWLKRVREEATNARRHPLHAWAHWPQDAAQVTDYKSSLRTGVVNSWPDDAAPFLHPSMDFDQWFPEDWAFDIRARTKLAWLTDDSPLRPIRGAAAPQTWIHSGLRSRKLEGTLRSPTFTIDKPYLDFLALRRGGGEKPHRGDYKMGQVHVIIDGFQIVRDPLWGKLTTHIPHSESARWFRVDLAQFVGQRAYLEIEDPDDCEVVIERIVLHDQSIPELPVNELLIDPLAAEDVKTADDAARSTMKLFRTSLQRLKEELTKGAPAVSADQLPALADIINWVSREAALLPNAPPPSERAIAFASQRREMEAELPQRQFTLAMTAGTPEDEHLLIRGNHKKPGDEVPRRFLEAFGGENQGVEDRQTLANDLLSQPNPLVPRVMVNRLWQHLFGRGIVPTSDDFGKMGQSPSHPELLDWLAGNFVRREWSIKQMQRMLVTTHAFRMSSRAEAQGLQPLGVSAEERDPQNILLHRANVQRLEGEALRDSLLLLSGRLDDRMYGPSVLPHLSEFMEGRGRPGQSGPLDGDGRRSVYINVRRNFLTPLFLAFDFPTPFTTMGRRSTSNVPAQALTLMNNPFVVQQADRWVRSTEGIAIREERIRRLYLTAFSRPATDDEVAAAGEFLELQAAEYGTPSDPRAWTDLAHVLLNVKEFVFVE